MRSLRALLLLTFMLEAACVRLDIPAVERVVANVLAANEDYVYFQGNDTNSTSVVTSSSTNLFKRQTAYWYENINHQGISAFGPGGYQVFRNVKSYGAKGMSKYLQRRR